MLYWLLSLTEINHNQRGRMRKAQVGTLQHLDRMHRAPENGTPAG